MLEVNELNAEFEGDDPEYAARVLTEILEDAQSPTELITSVPLRNGDQYILIEFDERELEVRLYIDGHLRKFDDETVLLIDQLYF